ncbi:hypothetical protein WS67_02360 [Burkholderia singularis]|uniref:Uncharacterized protein n=1 Tax=Burkholderia singularis TaxID=1503053 RepID=A0A118DLI5_9BURK|nr:hypothetical protein WS67_02360 [Burkholderia singularis]
MTWRAIRLVWSQAGAAMAGGLPRESGANRHCTASAGGASGAARREAVATRGGELEKRGGAR